MVDADKANESSTNARKLDTGKEKSFKHIVFCFLLFFLVDVVFKIDQEI